MIESSDNIDSRILSQKLFGAEDSEACQEFINKLKAAGESRESQCKELASLMDADGDGTLSEAEVLRMWNAMTGNDDSSIDDMDGG